MKWINIYNRAPEEGQRVLTYFDVFDRIEIHTYNNVSQKDDGIFGTHLFFNKSGFLTDDIVYWMPLPEKPNELEDYDNV